MPVVAFEANFHALYCYATLILGTKEERIHMYVKDQNIVLQVLFVHMIFAKKEF